MKPFTRGNKTDANDAVAIIEAAQRPNLRFVPIKTLHQQDIQSLHRIRERLVAQGKPKKVALIAYARKQIITLNAMMKNRTYWEESMS